MQDFTVFTWSNVEDFLRKTFHYENETLCCTKQIKEGVKCRLIIHKKYKTKIDELINNVAAAGSWTAAKTFLEDLSKMVMCQRHHQKDGEQLLGAWQKELNGTEKHRRTLDKRPRAPRPNTASTLDPKLKSETKENIKPELDVSVIKTEADDEDEPANSSLADIPDIRHHTFIPYGKQRTQREINKKIKGLVGRPLSDTELKHLHAPGYIYMYTIPSASRAKRPHLKIGSAGHLNQRLRQWERACGYSPDWQEASKIILHSRVERLVQNQLWASRRREEQCPVCRRGHNEFFDVPRCDASGAIGLWTGWMWHEPYGEDGFLKKEWQAKLREVDLDDPDCWKKFTEKE